MITVTDCLGQTFPMEDCVILCPKMGVIEINAHPVSIVDERIDAKYNQ